jgi:hypothetical protein
MYSTFPGLRLSPNIHSVPLGEENQALTIVAMGADECKVSLEKE